MLWLIEPGRHLGEQSLELLVKKTAIKQDTRSMTVGHQGVELRGVAHARRKSKRSKIKSRKIVTSRIQDIRPIRQSTMTHTQTQNQRRSWLLPLHVHILGFDGYLMVVQLPTYVLNALCSSRSLRKLAASEASRKVHLALYSRALVTSS